MARNYNESQLVYVTMGTIIKYVFPSRLKDSLRNNLGQVPITEAVSNVTGYIVGANAPKPPRASKKFPTGTETSFISHDKGPALKADGWKILRPKYPSYTAATELSKGYKITINGITYAFHSAEIPSGISFPGVDLLRKEIDSSDDTSNFVWGAEFPKPARIFISNDQGKTFSTYIDPNDETSAKASGYTPKGGLYTAKAFNAKYLGIID